jgi:hypothetical protein
VHAVAGADQELVSEDLAELLERVAHARLRHPAPSRGTAHAAFLEQGIEREEEAERRAGEGPEQVMRRLHVGMRTLSVVAWPDPGYGGRQMFVRVGWIEHRTGRTS